MKQLIYILILLCCLHTAGAQDLSAIGKGKAFKVSGGVAASGIGYASNGTARRNPFDYYLNGNLNLSIYNWNIPFSFSYSNRNFDYVQPFNQYSLHPTYKSVTAHLGWTSMAFSPYTLNGHQFYGVGAEVAPQGKFSYSAFYGRLKKAVGFDTLQPYNQPAYKRMGYGFKAAFDNQLYTVAVNVFRAKDDSLSLQAHPESGLMPQENMAIGISSGVTLVKKLKWTAEYGTSALTRNLGAAWDSLHGKFSATHPFMKQLNATATYHAVRSNITYQAKTFSVGFGFERVDPGYETLGAYYFTNDFQNVTINFAQSIFQKLTITGNAGVQKDDLKGDKLSSLQRIAAAFSISYVAGPRFQADLNYSNFQSYTHIKPQFESLNQLTPYDNLDTLNFTQLAQNANLNLNYQLKGDKSRRQSLQAMFSFQDAADQQGPSATDNGGMQFFNANTGYNLVLVPQQTSLTAAVNMSYNTLPGNNSLAWGPTVALSRPFLNKHLKTRVAGSYTTTALNGSKLMSLLNIRAAAGYTVLQKHQLSLGMVSLFRNNKANAAGGAFRECTATVGYNYSF